MPFYNLDVRYYLDSQRLHPNLDEPNLGRFSGWGGELVIAHDETFVLWEEGKLASNDLIEVLQVRVIQL